MNAFLKRWKELAHERKITRYDMALYCLSKAILKEDPLRRARYFLSKSFTPVTKQIKLDNGHWPYMSLWEALYSVLRNCENKDRYKHCDSDLMDTFSGENLKDIIDIIGIIKGAGYGEVNLKEEVRCLTA